MVLIAMAASAQHNYVNGFCTDDGCTDIYEPATLANGYYEIDNGGKLFWFANYVNSNHRSVSAKLTADVDLENREWPIICPGTSYFSGEFDGQGHTISNLKIEADESASKVAFIGYYSGTKDIKNFKINGNVTSHSTGASETFVAGVVAWASGANKIEDVWSFVDISTPDAVNSSNNIIRIGGIIARTETSGKLINRCVYGGTINAYNISFQAGGILGFTGPNGPTVSNCLFTGTIKTTSNAYIGGIIGYCNQSTAVFSDNLSIGSFDLGGTTYSGIIVGKRSSGSFSNNYILSGKGLTKACGSGSISATTVSTSQLTSGTLPESLGLHDWVQGENYPIPSVNHIFGADGFCIKNDGAYQPATLVNGYYEIDNAGKLFWLAQQVNNGTGTTYNAKLTADIDLESRNWTPMGNNINKYTGEFDGQGYSITNLNINSNTDATAFIGYHGGTNDVRNFSISGEITYTGNSDHNIGGVLAYNVGKNKVEDVVCSINISAPNATGNIRLGGIAAKAEEGPTVNRCVYSGTINGYNTKMQVAGIVGWCNNNTSPYCVVTNCLFSGRLISNYIANDGTTAYVGGVFGYSFYAVSLSNNLCIGRIDVPEGATKYVGALMGGKRSSGGTFTNNHVKINGVSNLSGTGYNSITATEITDVSVLSDGTTLAALGTANWAQDPVDGHPVPKAFTCSESNGGAVAAVAGTVCAYNFNVLKNAVKDYTTVDMSGANMTSNIADADVESMLINNALVYVPGSTGYCGKNIVNGGICDDFELTDGKPFSAPADFTATAASYSRNISNAWGTICLPYEVESDDDVTYYTTGTINGDVLTLTSTDVVPAGTPAIFKAAGSSITAAGSNVNVKGAVQTESVTDDDITLIGSFAKQTILAADVPNAYYISGGKFWHATGTLSVNPFRAYFTTNSASPSNGFSITVDDDNVTAIQALTGESDTTITAIYTVDGKQVGDLQQGLNIVKFSNGKTKKIMIK